jgi:hypothetical protein
MQTMQAIDPITKSGFLELASAFGRPRAHEARIAAYDRLYERDKDFRWHGERWARAKRSAEFERDYEAANPGECQLLRDNGIGY